ncbi:ORF45 [Fowl aviadenovirus 4]|uniref:ORF45 n=1 Tax=Fowl aviadenovirus 4 TaxID=130663 RepID=A0A8D5UCW4_FADV4|nr:ORF45 [Fowl aviadenovirus 4]
MDFASNVFCPVQILEVLMRREWAWLSSVCFLVNIHMKARSGLRVYAFCVTGGTRKSSAWVNIV